MWKNFFVTEWRIMKRQWGYSFINVLGLSLGIACCILILLFIRHEVSYDSFHEKNDRIYRLAFSIPDRLDDQFMANTPAINQDLFTNNLPEVVTTASLISSRNTTFSVGSARFIENEVFYTTPSFFEVFSFPLLSGNPNTALEAPHSIVLTQKSAEKLFGDRSALGETILLGTNTVLTVTGIAEDVPQNSHLQFDYLISASTLGAYHEDAWSHQGYTYLLLNGEAEALSSRLTAFYADYLQANWLLPGIRLTLEPLRSLHLNPTAVSDAPHTDPRYLLLFGTVALLILLTASINYINLSTALSTRRVLEVGLRRVLGADKSHVRLQFWVESLLISFMAMLAAAGLVKLFMPFLNTVIQKQLSVSFLGDPFVGFSMLGITLIVGIISGLYPAVFMSRYTPAHALKGISAKINRGLSIRKGLVIVQLSVSTILIISTLVIANQIEYIRSKKTGFNQEQVVQIHLHGAMDQASFLKQRVENLPGVLSASLAMGGPIGGGMFVQQEFSGNEFEIRVLAVDADFAETLDLEIVEGRSFSASFGSDSTHAVVINQILADRIGSATDPDVLGASFSIYDEEKVIGVVNNFHTASLHYPMVPTALVIEPRFYNNLLVRIAPERTQETLASLEQTWATLIPTRPVEYAFLDDNFDALYRTEQQASQLINAFTLLAIFITCLGIFALSALSTKQRTKEIGIRKTLGASVQGILILFVKDFLYLSLLAAIIAIPVSYMAMNTWLDSFAYHAQVGPGLFMMALLLVIGITLLTASFHAIKAAFTNPVDTLRYE